MAEKTDVSRTVAVSVMGSVLAGFLVQILSKVLLPDLTSVLSLTVRLYIFTLIILAIGFAIYYLFILGGSTAVAESPDRESYERLEARLLTGGTPNKVYNDILARALDAVDRFFGDPNRTDVSWFTRVTGWDTKGARWTAQAYDRCLLLALLYPVAPIFLTWAVTGHAGDGGKALLLKEGLAYWRRMGSLIALAVSLGLALYGARTQGWRRLVALAGAVAGAVVVVVVLILAWLAWAEEHHRLGVGLAGFSVIFGAASLIAPIWLGSRPGWDIVGASLLFLGLFTLVNAPASPSRWCSRPRRSMISPCSAADPTLTFCGSRRCWINCRRIPPPRRTPGYGSRCFPR